MTTSAASYPTEHLNLAKLGGLDRLIAGGRRLKAAGIGVMAYVELYGADGLIDDPAGVLTYAEGALVLSSGSGLGSGLGPRLGFSPEAVLWERHL
jgi:hypothetical protein